MIRSGKIKRRMLAIMLSLGVFVSVFASTAAGLKLYNKTSHAAGNEKTFYDSETNIQWAYTVLNGKATNVRIHGFIGGDSNYLGGDTGSITIPASFSYTTPDPEGGTATTVSCDVVSIGSPDGTTDSFFNSTVTSHIPTDLTVDASAVNTLTTVSDYVMAGRSGITLELPRSLQSLGSHVLENNSLANSSNKNKIYINSLNNTFGSSYSGVEFHGYANSKAKEVFGENLRSDNNYPSAANAPKFDTGSFKYEISYPEGLNCDTHTPTSFMNSQTVEFSGYMYKSTAAEYAVYNKLDPNALPKTRKHHTFNGYFTSATNGEGIKIFNGTPASSTAPAAGSFNTDADFSGITNSTVNLYAQWTAGKVTLTYHAVQSTSGSVPAMQEVDYGSTVQLENNTCKRTGHTFRGWALESNGVKKYDDGATTDNLYDDIDLYTCWTTNSYTIQYDPNGGTGNPMGNQTFSYNDRTTTHVAENTYQRDGYTFKCWALSKTPGPTDPVFSSSISVDEVIKKDAALSTDDAIKVDPYIETHATALTPIRLYAIWEKGRYQVTYVDGKNAAPFSLNPETRDCDDHSPLPTRPPIQGHTFLGWSDMENGHVDYPVGENLTRDLAPNGGEKTVYAIYQPHTFKIKYVRSVSTGVDSEGHSTSVLDGGPEMNDTECTYGSYLSSFSSCRYTRPGCRFVGWKRTTSSSEPPAVILPYSAGSSVAGSIDYTAGQGTASITNVSNNETIYVYPVWQKERYTLHYQGDGTSGLSDETFEYGDTITLPTLTMRDHTFKGWMESDNTYDTDQLVFSAPARNLTVTARWDNDHFITISPDSYINTITASINGTQKTLVSNGTLTSMTFKGGEQISNIKITSVNNQLIKSYNITNESGTSLASGTLSTPASTVTINRTITFPTGSNMNIAITPKAAEFKITFNTNGGIIIGTTPTTYTYGQELLLPTYVVKDGSTFYGWKNSAGTMVSAISKTQTGDQTFTAVWNDPNVTDLPQGAKAVASANGKIVTITYANKNTEDVNIAAQGISLKGGSNSIQFKTADGKAYLTTVNYIAATDLPSTIKATYVEGAVTATITYSDGTTQTIAVNKYNSDTTLYGTRIYFDGIDGKRYTVIPSATANPNPSASPAPTTNPGSNQKPQPDEYYMISKVSYNVRSGKASATNPYNWNAKSINVKDSVKIYGKSYKVTKITANAFYGMPKLKTLVIGKNVTSVGRNAARDCKKLKTINIYSKKLFTMGKNWLKNIAKNAYVYINAPKKQYRKIRDLIRKKSGCPKSTHFRRF